MPHDDPFQKYLNGQTSKTRRRSKQLQEEYFNSSNFIDDVARELGLTLPLGQPEPNQTSPATVTFTPTQPASSSQANQQSSQHFLPGPIFVEGKGYVSMSKPRIGSSLASEPHVTERSTENHIGSCNAGYQPTNLSHGLSSDYPKAGTSRVSQISSTDQHQSDADRTGPRGSEQGKDTLKDWQEPRFDFGKYL
ncbi:uncharacterized protein IL334_002207 [Kwoniella shivajii]|uniref:mRNA stability protein n=1 Tax=Kwoniella shivajii TaxID=564305 RepID=A0ABZ1CVB8_9TREE|nr:hypothetical protein IL334_002207 [Kwoniella shivajii]